MGIQVGADAAQQDGPENLHLRDCKHYGATVVWVGPVPYFVDGAHNVGPVRWQRGSFCDDVP